MTCWVPVNVPNRSTSSPPSRPPHGRLFGHPGCSLGRLYLVREGDEVGLESLYQGDVLIDLLVGVVGHLGEDNLARRGRWWLLGALG